MDSQSAGVVPVPDWYPDPIGRHELRYWDGAAWTEDVADSGQQAVDPLEAPTIPSAGSPAPMVSAPPGDQAGYVAPVAPPASSPVPAPYAPADPKRASGGAKKFVIAGAVLILVVALGAWGYSVLNTSTKAKNAAAASITAARTAIAQADPAVEPGSHELTESQKSKSELDQATLLYGQGSVFAVGRYRDAKSKADDARRIAQGITHRVEAMAANASSASPEDAIDLYFALEKLYPRTQQGQDAIAKAADVLTSDLIGGADISNLASIKAFCDKCPGDVPSEVYDAATTSIKSIASDSLGMQAAYVRSNRSWVKKLRGKGANFTIQGTVKADTSELTRALGMLSAVQGTSFRSALTLLRDSSKLGERCSKIGRSPVRKTGSAHYFSRGQVNTISKLSSQMGAKLSRARTLLSNL